MFLNTNFSHYILTNINNNLINLYNIIKIHTNKYIQTTHKLFVPKTNYTKIYYQFHKKFNKNQNPFHQTILFLYLNHYNYNNLYRYNLHNKFNIPFNHYKKPYFPKTKLYHFTKKTQNTFFYYKSYTNNITHTNNTSIIYYNPPYTPLSTTTNFTTYHTNNFTLKQQTHLTKITKNLIKHHIPILISNHNTILTHK